MCEIKKSRKLTQTPPLLYNQVYFKGSRIALCAFLEESELEERASVHAFNVFVQGKAALQLLEELQGFFIQLEQLNFKHGKI